MPIVSVKFATRGLMPTFSTALRSTVGNVTAELVVVTATAVCSASLAGSFHGFSRVRSATTATISSRMITTPTRVVPR